MTDHRENMTNVIDLVGDLCNGTLGLDELPRLERLLLADHTALQSYIEYMDLHAELAVQAPGEGNVGRYILPERPEGCFAQNVPDPFSLVHWTREYFSQPGPLSILVAAIFVVCLISILNILPAPTYQPSRSNHVCNTSTNSPGRKPRDAAGKLKLVARITGMHNCRWSPEGRAPYSYDHLGLGRELKLDAGLIKITYYNGAQLVLEGPVEFKVEKPNACRLDLGKLTAKVSERAIGFTVETPAMSIVDLGTEFGVVVEKDNFTDVHVFQGVVEAELLTQAGATGKKLRITEGQSARLDQATLRFHRATANSGYFTQHMMRQSSQILDLLDMVAGGNGFGRRRDAGIWPITGEQKTHFHQSHRDFGNGRYVPVTWHKLIDGIFIPDGGQDTVHLTTDGHTFDGFPDTDNRFYGPIWACRPGVRGQAVVADPRENWVRAIREPSRFSPAGRGLLALHSNVGITFDLQAIRDTHQDVRIARFRAVAANVKPEENNTAEHTLADIWVFVDGREKFSREKINSGDGVFQIDIELSSQDRFLTLVATDAGNTCGYDWTVFGDPVLELAAEEKESDDRNISSTVKE